MKMCEKQADFKSKITTSHKYIKLYVVALKYRNSILLCQNLNLSLSFSLLTSTHILLPTKLAKELI